MDLDCKYIVRIQKLACSAFFVGTYISNLKTMVISVLRCWINETTLILISYIFFTCAAISLHILHMVFIFHTWFATLEQILINLISLNAINICITDSWIRDIMKYVWKGILHNSFLDIIPYWKILSFF